MKVFFDTSSLVKLYHQEDGSDVVQSSLENVAIEDIVLSELTILEFRSAFWRKVREGDLDEKLAVEAIACFENDRDYYQWVVLGAGIIESAKTLIMKYGNRGLRTLDSLQLASALALKDDECIFLTFDMLLKSLMQDEKLNVI